MSSLSYRIIQMVREKISTQYVKATDTDVANALSVSRATVSAYKADEAIMSSDTLGAAQIILQVPPDELLDLSLGLALAAARTPHEKAVWDSARLATAYLRERARSFDAQMEQFKNSGEKALSAKKRGKVAALGGAAILSLLMLAPNPLRASTSASLDDGRSIHYAK